MIFSPSTFHPQLLTLDFSPSTFYPRLFTLDFLPSTFHPRLFTLDFLPSPSTFYPHPRLFTLALDFYPRPRHLTLDTRPIDKLAGLEPVHDVMIMKEVIKVIGLKVMIDELSDEDESDDLGGRNRPLCTIQVHRCCS